jgi:hypothetical protein
MYFKMLVYSVFVWHGPLDNSQFFSIWIVLSPRSSILFIKQYIASLPLLWHIYLCCIYMHGPH